MNSSYATNFGPWNEITTSTSPSSPAKLTSNIWPAAFTNEPNVPFSRSQSPSPSLSRLSPHENFLASSISSAQLVCTAKSRSTTPASAASASNDTTWLLKKNNLSTNNSYSSLPSHPMSSPIRTFSANYPGKKMRPQTSNLCDTKRLNLLKRVKSVNELIAEQGERNKNQNRTEMMSSVCALRRKIAETNGKCKLMEFGSSQNKPPREKTIASVGGGEMMGTVKVFSEEEGMMPCHRRRLRLHRS